MAIGRVGRVCVWLSVSVKVHVRVRVSLLLVFWQRIERILSLFIY